MPVVDKTGEEKEFLDIMAAIMGRTIIDHFRLYMLFQFARRARKLAGGMIAEVGVYKGGTARLLAEMFPSRGIVLFDTFEGMPETDHSKDLHRKGNFSDTSLEDVRKFLEGFPMVTIRAGVFPGSVQAGSDEGPFCFVHADGDIYTTTRDVCNFFIPRLVPGGMIVFDDYGAISCPGAKLAVDQCIGKEDLLYLTTGQAVFIKGER